MNDRHFSRDPRAGFSLVEVVVALVILAVGVLGLAGTTAVVVRQVTLSNVTTERATALQTVVERLRATPYYTVAAGSETVGLFTAHWTVTEVDQSKLLEIVTVGPGLVSGSGFPLLGQGVADTLVYRILEP